MLRKILVPLETSPATAAATELAVQIAQEARKLNGEYRVSLRGLGIVDVDQIPKGRFASLVPTENILAEAHQTAEGLVAAFRKQVLAAGIPESQVETYVTEGGPCQKIIHHHVFTDLVVMSSVCSFPPVLHDYETLVALMFEASRPLIMVPNTLRPVKTVVMLMDGTAPSSRMLYAYAHLNPFPGARLLVVHAENEERSYDLKDFFDRLQEYLASFDIRAERHRLSGTLHETLPDFLRAEKADLVAAGLHREQLLHRFATPLRLMRLRVEDLMQEVGTSLFLVH